MALELAQRKCVGQVLNLPYASLANDVSCPIIVGQVKNLPYSVTWYGTQTLSAKSHRRLGTLAGLRKELSRLAAGVSRLLERRGTA